VIPIVHELTRSSRESGPKLFTVSIEKTSDTDQAPLHIFMHVRNDYSIDVIEIGSESRFLSLCYFSSSFRAPGFAI
jgi:hypothetical protein